MLRLVFNCRSVGVVDYREDFSIPAKVLEAFLAVVISTTFVGDD
jgi:hypothetical protein